MHLRKVNAGIVLDGELHAADVAGMLLLLLRGRRPRGVHLGSESALVTDAGKSPFIVCSCNRFLEGAPLASQTVSGEKCTKARIAWKTAQWGFLPKSVRTPFCADNGEFGSIRDKSTFTCKMAVPVYSYLDALAPRRPKPGCDCRGRGS